MSGAVLPGKGEDMRNRVFFAVVLSLLMGAGSLLAGPQARISGWVHDSEGKAISSAVVTITTDEQPSFKKVIKVGEDGKFKALILDATKQYIFHVEAPGYILHEEPFKVPIGTMDNDFEFSLKTQQENVATTVADLKTQPGYKELEEGRGLIKEGKMEEAEELLKKAVELVPDLVPAMEHLAEVQYELGKKPEALKTAQNCLEADDESPGCLAVAANVSGELGDMESRDRYMARYQELNPDDPATLFNQAVEFLNAMDDVKARPLLEQCLDVDPEYPKCLFELGMLKLRSGDMEGAKAELQKYLEVAPDGEDATTVVETVKYL